MLTAISLMIHDIKPLLMFTGHMGIVCQAHFRHCNYISTGLSVTILIYFEHKNFVVMHCKNLLAGCGLHSVLFFWGFETRSHVAQPNLMKLSKIYNS